MRMQNAKQLHLPYKIPVSCMMGVGDSMRFGDILRELLEEREISQRAFAAIFHLAPTTIGNYVNNVTEPDYETLKAFADYFHVSIDYLLDHRVDARADHEGERAKELYNQLPPDRQQLWIAIGKVLMQQKETSD